MSGTDRSEVYHGRCLCDSAEVIVYFCTPDHPYPTSSKWFEHEIKCTSCNATYDLIEQGQGYVFVRRSDLAAHEDISKRYSASCETLMATEPVKSLLKDLVAVIDREPSMAAKHRFLVRNHLVLESYSTFTRKWRGAGDWVEKNVSAGNLDRIMTVLHKQDPGISKDLSRLSELNDLRRAPVPIVGEPLFDPTRYIVA